MAHFWKVCKEFYRAFVLCFNKLIWKFRRNPFVFIKLINKIRVYFFILGSRVMITKILEEKIENFKSILF